MEKLTNKFIDKNFFDNLKEDSDHRDDIINKRASELIRQGVPIYVAIQQASCNLPRMRFPAPNFHDI